MTNHSPGIGFGYSVLLAALSAVPGIAVSLFLVISLNPLVELFPANSGAQGVALGHLGTNPANKAANIYATYLEEDKERQLALFLETVHRGQTLQQSAPGLANAWLTSGHFRTGILNAPATASALARWISAGEPPAEQSSWSAGRFARR